MIHKCVSKLTIIGSDNGLSPGRRQAISWTNAGISLIVPSGKNSPLNLHRNSYISIQKMQLKMSSPERRQFCLGPNVLKLTWVNSMETYATCMNCPCYCITLVSLKLFMGGVCYLRLNDGCCLPSWNVTQKPLTRIIEYRRASPIHDSGNTIWRAVGYIWEICPRNCWKQCSYMLLYNTV